MKLIGLRYAVLEHTGHPDDPAGRHFDLLLEDGDGCLTWRLADLPRADARPVDAVSLPRHRLEWLEREAGAVSGGRGFARRVDAGRYSPARPDDCPAAGSAPQPLIVRLHGGMLAGLLRLEPKGRGWAARLDGSPSGHHH
jgi:hypothetical protein